jgi:hypothetical protein
MWRAFRILIALTCVAAAGCKTTREREEELRQLEESASAYRAAAADADLRGNPIQSAALDETANELDERRARQEQWNKEDEEFEKEHPIYAGFVNFYVEFMSELFLDIFWNSIFGHEHDDDDDDEWDDMPAYDYESSDDDGFDLDFHFK